MQTARWWHAEPTVLGRGCDRQNFVAVETGLFDVGAQHVDERVRLRHRLDVRQFEIVDVGKVIEHSVELTRVAFDFLWRNVETRKARNFRHIGGGETL